MRLSIKHDYTEEVLYEKDENFSAPEYGDKLRINNHWYRMTDKYFTFDGSESVCVIVVEPYDPERGNLI